MDYRKIYLELTSRAKGRNIVVYTEKHHILPRALGGKNTKENIVYLTAREHYIAHLCLWKSSAGIDRKKMAFAVIAFKRQNKTQVKEYTFRFNSYTYEKAKQEAMKATSKRMIGNTYSKGIHYKHSYIRDSTNLGQYERTPEIRAKISASRIGKAMGTRNAMNDPEARKKVGLSKLGRKLYIGPLGERRMYGPGWEPEGYHRDN